MVDDSDLPWGVRLHRWRADVKLWSQQELVDQVVRLAFETKEDRGTRLDVRLVGKWETGSVRRPQSVYRRLLSGLGAPIPAGARQADITRLPHMQEVLDTALARALDETKARFVSAAHIDTPSSRIAADPAATGTPDVVMTYPMRGLISRPKWNDTIRGSTKSLWLYGMAELGYALDDDVPRILQDAARGGCDIRILLLDPEYHGGVAIDADEGSPPGTLASRIRSAQGRFQKISKECGEQMQIRVYSAPPTVSIVRGDDRMLVTPYLRFFVGGNSPSIELQCTPTRKMFDCYTRHFESTWDLAKECVE